MKIVMIRGQNHKGSTYTIGRMIADKIEKDTTQIANRILRKQNAKAGFKTKVMFMLMRMMQKANLGSGGDDRAYWEEKRMAGERETVALNITNAQ